MKGFYHPRLGVNISRMIVEFGQRECYLFFSRQCPVMRNCTTFVESFNPKTRKIIVWVRGRLHVTFVKTGNEWREL